MAAVYNACTTNTMDTDDFLEAVFMNENRCQDEGFQEGQADGRQKGLQEGYHMGCRKGYEIGAELGFYLGFSEKVKESLTDASNNKPRVLKTIENLSQLIECFPMTDPKHETLFEQVQAIRAKFKQLTSLLGVQTQYTPEGGGLPGASF